MNSQSSRRTGAISAHSSGSPQLSRSPTAGRSRAQSSTGRQQSSVVGRSSQTSLLAGRLASQATTLAPRSVQVGPLGWSQQAGQAIPSSRGVLPGFAPAQPGAPTQGTWTQTQFNKANQGTPPATGGGHSSTVVQVQAPVNQATQATQANQGTPPAMGGRSSPAVIVQAPAIQASQAILAHQGTPAATGVGSSFAVAAKGVRWDYSASNFSGGGEPGSYMSWFSKGGRTVHGHVEVQDVNADVMHMSDERFDAIMNP